MIAGFSFEDILHEALVAPRSALVPLPDTQILERPGLWQMITPSLTRGGMNEVVCTELPEDTADQAIDEAIEPYRRLDLRFRWTVRPDSKPADLAERLARRGLLRSESLVMARATAGAPSEYGESVTVEEVDLAGVDELTRVMAEGWQVDPGPLGELHRRMLAAPAGRNRFFLARDEGTAAAVASYMAADRSAYLVGAVALPAHRGRGLYRALVHARLRDAESRGLKLATTVAKADTSAPILARLGFETVCTVPTYVNF